MFKKFTRIHTLPLAMAAAAFLLIAFALPAAAEVKVARSGDKVSIEIDGKPYTELHLAAPKIYLHPLRSASGKIISRMYPMSEQAGELKDHPHHRGLWYGHGDVNGYDFWANDAAYADKRKNLGTQELVKVVDMKSGKESGSVKVLIAWKDPQGNTLLEETREIVVHATPDARILDFDISLKAVAESKFGDTKEGIFALRTSPEFELPGRPRTPETPVRSGRMINSNGVDGKAIWGKQAPWVDYSATVDGEKIGIAMFDNPRNPRFPTYWHARDYGLFALNPFGVHDFENDKSKDGSMTLKKGESTRFRYRVLIHSGDEKEANIQKLFNEYSRKAS